MSEIPTYLGSEGPEPLNSVRLGARTVALVLTWVKIKNAEYEVVQRLRHAARNIGVDVLIVDNDGYKLWSSAEGDIVSGTRITSADCDFVISLHFESPKLYDVFSYVAIWNPPEFYGPDYQTNVSKFASHDAALSCRSALADTHARNIFWGLGRPLEDTLPVLFHSVPAPFFEPSVSDTSRLFYIGINWERINGERGRHHDVLEFLDAEELIDIYGPKKFLDVEPWRGFKCYRDEIPFDGRSVIERIHESGICLALSSKAHQKCGIMSNRLFEGLAAGAVIIANPNPFIDLYFSDLVYVVDDTQPPRALAAQVRDLVLSIRQNPAAARERAFAGQQRFREMFTLEQSLTDIFLQHDQRVKTQREKLLGAERHEITVIVEYAGSNASELLGMLGRLGRQVSVDIDVIVICDVSLEQSLASSEATAELNFARSVRIYSELLNLAGENLDGDVLRYKVSGPAVARAMRAVKTPFFCFMHLDDLWFDDHLASLAKVLSANPVSAFACSGKITEEKPDGESEKRHFEQLRFDRLSDMLYCALPREVGRFLYRSSLLEGLAQPLMLLLDGFHYRYFNIEALLRGPLSQTCRATYVHLRWQMDQIDTLYTEAQQADFVIDSFRGDMRWIEKSAQLARIYATAQPVFSDPSSLLIAQPDRFYKFTSQGDGLAFLRGGFSGPEPGFTWVDGLNALLEFRVDESVHGYDLVLVAAGRSTKSGELQTARVSINGEPDEEITLDDDLAEIRVSLPEKIKASTRRIFLRLTLKHAELVEDADGKTSDPRLLGMRIAGAGIYSKATKLAAGVSAPAIAQQNKLYSFSAESEGLAFLRNGFSEPELESTWMDGLTAYLAFRVDEPVTGCELVLLVAGRKSKSGMHQAVRISVNGEPDEEIIIDEEPAEIRVALPDNVTVSTRRILVRLTLDHAENVWGPDGSVTDARSLGLRVFGAGIFSVQAHAAEAQSNPGQRAYVLAQPDRMYRFTEDGDGVSFLLHGFSLPEAASTWIDGLSAVLDFRVGEAVDGCEIVLLAASQIFKSDQHQIINVWVNDEPCEDLVATGALTEFRIALPAKIHASTRRIFLQLKLSHAENVLDEAGEVIDPRRLGLRIAAAGIFSKQVQRDPERFPDTAGSALQDAL